MNSTTTRAVKPNAEDAPSTQARWNWRDSVDPDLEAAWQQTARAALETPPDPPRHFHDVKEQFLVLITCRDETQQVALLERFLAEGLECKALVS